MIFSKHKELLRLGNLCPHLGFPDKLTQMILEMKPIEFKDMNDKLFYDDRLLINSLYLDRDDRNYQYYNGVLFTGTEGEIRKNGSLASYTEFVDGIPHGKSEAWFESGKLKKECYYERGCVIGTSKGWYESGQLKKEVINESPANYIMKEWYESGQIKSELHVKNLKAAIHKEWDAIGNLTKDVKI